MRSLDFMSSFHLSEFKKPIKSKLEICGFSFMYFEVRETIQSSTTKSTIHGALQRVQTSEPLDI